MAGNTFGKIFQITTWGESHGPAVGVVVDGCPSGLALEEKDIQPELDRRRPGQSAITTQRQEADQVQILSGVFEGQTTGTPISLSVTNKDHDPKDYENLKDLFRPGHADYTYQQKYGLRDWRGGGRSSARETLARVAAGAIAKKYLKAKAGLEFLAFTSQIGEIKAAVDPATITPKAIESNPVRCPDPEKAEAMTALIEKTKKAGDSLGGVITGIIKNAPVGLGEPVFDKLPADLAKAMLSVNATKGFEYGSGFAGAAMKGSEHNDQFQLDGQQQVVTGTNHAGGTLGGITTGADIYFQVAFKPTATIQKAQKTLDKNQQTVTQTAAGRHDPCVVPRAVPIVEAMAALVLMDHYLRAVIYHKS